MNRRRFIKTLCSALAALPFVGLMPKMKYYTNPDEVGYLGYIDHQTSTTFVTLDGSTVTLDN